MSSVSDETDEMEDMEDTDEAEMDTEEEQTEDYTGSDDSMHTEQFVAQPPVGITHGEPRLDRLPTNAYLAITWFLLPRDVLALRKTSKSLATIISFTPEIWSQFVSRIRRDVNAKLLLGPVPVVMPKISVDTFQEAILRCSYILHRQWANPAFQARLVGKSLLRHSVSGMDEIIFVPDSMGRYFLTASRKSVNLWTLEPDGVPHACRQIFPEDPLSEKEMIVKTLVCRPKGSMVAYLAVQCTQADSYRLRTEIHQLHLSNPGVLFQRNLGLSAVHVTEGALVAFTEYLIAYALGDPAQTVLVCCWVTRQSTRLFQPIRDWEVRWQHQSCRAVTVSNDFILVVRDSAAEIYPRAPWMTLDSRLQPALLNATVVTGALVELPPTYATHIVPLATSFVADVHVHVHAIQCVHAVLPDGRQVHPRVRVISLIGLARSNVTTDPSIPYFVAQAQPYLIAPNSPVPLTPVTEWLKYTFHVHALQPRHPHLSYGPIVAGANGRGVMLATNVGVGGGPRQYVLKFQHPSRHDLGRIVQGAIARMAPPQPPPQQPHPQPPHPEAPHPHPHVQPIPDPFGPLVPLMRLSLDILRGMTPVWHTSDGFAYEFITWDEGAGTIMLASRRGDAVVLECAFPPYRPPPAPQTSLAARGPVPAT